MNETGEESASMGLNDFVLYAERSLSLGKCDTVCGGDVGVRTAAEKGFGVQLKVGDCSFIDRCNTVYSPSVSIGQGVKVGRIETNSFVDNGIRLGVEYSFPSSEMPPLPLAPSSGATGADVTVDAEQVTALLPGDYGALRVAGTLALNPGSYSFSHAVIADCARVVSIAGDVRISIGGNLVVGSKASIYPEFDGCACQLVILVAGSDGDEGSPAASIGECSEVTALLAAPHGTLSVADNTCLTGAFAGFDMAVGVCVRVCFDCGFPVQGQRGSRQLTGYVGRPDPSKAPLVGPVPADIKIPLAVGLPVRDPSGLKTFIQQVSDPKSSNFRKHITQAQFYAKYGATASEYAALQSWATSNGFTINATYPNNLLLSITGTAEQVESALYVNLVYRQTEAGVKFVTVDREPSLNLSVPILEITGLNDYIAPYHLGGLNGTGSGGNYLAADLRNAYLGVNSPNQALDGTGQVIGIVDFATFQQSDINTYAALQVPAQGQPPLLPPNVTVVAQEGGNPAKNSTIEATLDISLVYAMAPGAQILFFQGSTGITGHLDDILHQMATSSPALNVVSCSLGFGASGNAQQALDQMAANGVSFYTSSGDNGNVGDPGNNEDMDNQTLVGGTVLSTNPITSSGYPNPYYAGENTWTSSGGGIMTSVGIPGYQLAVSMATNGGSTQYRNYPDVSMLATQAEVIFQGKVNFVTGTSLSAPLWAGFTVLANQKSLENGNGLMGFINPTLYDIGLTSGSANDLYKICFNDIDDGGNNGGFESVAGYDLVTGWGTPTGALIAQLSSITPLIPNQPLTIIRITIKTGDDDAGGGQNGSESTADILLPGGGAFTVTLRTNSDPHWDNWSTHTVDAPIPASVNPPLTATKGIAGVRLNLIQSNPSYAADNWDVATLSVELLNPGSPPVCQLNLVGTSTLQDGSTGLVRLSQSPGSSGVGPTSQVFSTGPGSGCP